MPFIADNTIENISELVAKYIKIKLDLVFNDSYQKFWILMKFTNDESNWPTSFFLFVKPKQNKIEKTICGQA